MDLREPQKVRDLLPLEEDRLGALEPVTTLLFVAALAHRFAAERFASAFTHVRGFIATSGNDLESLCLFH